MIRTSGTSGTGNDRNGSTGTGNDGMPTRQNQRFFLNSTSIDTATVTITPHTAG